MVVFQARFLLTLGIYLAVAPVGDPAPGHVTGIAHIAFRVSDIARSRDFFHRLGYEEAFTRTDGHRILQSFFKVNDRQFIEIYAPTEKESRPQWLHLCFESDSLSDLHRKYESEDMKPEAIKSGAAGNIMSSVRGPESGMVEVTQYMPNSWHSTDRGKHLGAERISSELAGVRIPVAHPHTEARFYRKVMGASRNRYNSNIRVAIPANPEEQIELDPAPSLQAVQVVFRVDNLDNAVRQLRARGFQVQKSGQIFLLGDPDGNVLAFAEHAKDW